MVCRERTCECVSVKVRVRVERELGRRERERWDGEIGWKAGEGDRRG